MFDNFFNHIFLSFWCGEKKVGPNKVILLKRGCETYGDVVYDLRWTLKYIHSNGQTSHSVNISERANKWDVRRTIKRIEAHELPKRIKQLIEDNEGHKHS